MKPKLLFLIAEDWFFCSHFFERAVAARDAGYEVVVVTRVQKHGATIQAAGMRLIPIAIQRRSINPIRELRLLWEMLKIYLIERPDLVHHVASKPIFYGSLVARCLGNIRVLNAPVGMGYAFSSNDVVAKILRPLMQLAYRFLLNPPQSRVIFENGTDLNAFVSSHCVRAKDARLIKGAGIDLKKFHPMPRVGGMVTVMLIARMLRDKGVREFVEAARQLHASGVHARFVLVGSPDPGNPASIPESTISEWNGRNGIEYWGWRDDMRDVLSQADIVCLPSYREGLPKSLLEAAACAIPIVTTDTVGCRDVVVDGVNGLLVPVRDATAIASALRKLIESPELRATMGKSGRTYAEKMFATEIVIAETLAVYHELVPVAFKG